MVIMALFNRPHPSKVIVADGADNSIQEQQTPAKTAKEEPMDKQNRSKNSLLDIMPAKRRAEGESARAVPATKSEGATFINSDTIIEGKILAKNEVCIEGGFKGDIISKHHVVVGQSGKVEGTVEAKTMVLCGQVVGNLRILERLEMQATGQLLGDLETQPGALIIEKGARLHGHCSMGMTDKQQPLQPAQPQQAQNGQQGKNKGR